MLYPTVALNSPFLYYKNIKNVNIHNAIQVDCKYMKMCSVNENKFSKTIINKPTIFTVPYNLT